MCHLCHISVWQRKNTLIFHVKIGIHCYELFLTNVLKNSCLFICKDRSCKAQAKFELRGEFIKRTEITRANGGKPRIKYVIDREDPKLRDLSIWKVQNRSCRFEHSVSCEVDFYSHLRRKFYCLLILARIVFC
jgi:hypothetical protein